MGTHQFDFRLVLDTSDLQQLPKALEREGRRLMREALAREREKPRLTAAQRGKVSYRARHRHLGPKPAARSSSRSV